MEKYIFDVVHEALCFVENVKKELVVVRNLSLEMVKTQNELLIKELKEVVDALKGE
jgi:hypothetical protein